MVPPLGEVEQASLLSACMSKAAVWDLYFRRGQVTRKALGKNLARAIGVSPAIVSMWKKKKKPISAASVRKLWGYLFDIYPLYIEDDYDDPERDWFKPSHGLHATIGMVSLLHSEYRTLLLLYKSMPVAEWLATAGLFVNYWEVLTVDYSRESLSLRNSSEKEEAALVLMSTYDVGSGKILAELLAK